MQMLISIIVSLLKGYLVKLASREFIEYVIFQVADAAVNSTKTPHDNKFLRKLKKILDIKE